MRLPQLPALYVYPLVSAILLPATFFLTYSISVTLGHTELDWPYISDTATKPPESCIFSQLINVGSLLLAISFYIRYKQVSEYCSSYQMQRVYKHVNSLSLWLGWAGALGLSMIANFQETEVYWVHKIGLYLCFGCGVLWLWALAYTSSGLYPIQSSRLMLVSRCILLVINTSTFLSVLIFGEVARSKFHGDDPTKWKPSDGGWNFHIVSTVSEWIMAISLDFAILSLVPEFKQLEFEDPKIIVHIERRGFMEVNADDDYASYSHGESLLA